MKPLMEEKLTTQPPWVRFMFATAASVTSEVPAILYRAASRPFAQLIKHSFECFRLRDVDLPVSGADCLSLILLFRL
jgi:hypothetical protein